MQRTITIPIRRPPMTLNDQRRAHWQTVRKAKREAEQMVTVCVQAAKIPATTRAHIGVVWYAPDKRRRDADALSPFLKATLDALVACGVIEDDNHRFVPSVSMGIETDHRRPRIEVTITELEPA